MKIKDFTLTAIFLSIILLLAFTPFGFIHLGVIKATLIHIPIIIASIILGPKIGAFLGLMFGFTSIATNTISPTLLSFAFSPAIPVLGTSHGSFWALFIAIVPRVIIGFIPYYIFKVVQKVIKKNESNQKPALFLTALITTFIHTFLVMGSISLIFNEAYVQAINADSISAIYKAIIAVFFTNGLAEAVLAGIVTMAVAPPLLKVSKK
ncbi:ECF transporter S component [Lederbergia wuyishanensis]|uniref:Membrane protein n=1 Tax=Lederbergia wuyishanensis TaxID=1347903 RepID=A0ABU0D634_9BACI|nr:ECF transporter S component [Lederbergia wuyishanensis]MCJ8008703.1 ECF transporter S component [Lederbergia wuyishanensis]MDQ0343878.1 putative membrane protein [Lederbergia wuyishanensis]